MIQEVTGCQLEILIFRRVKDMTGCIIGSFRKYYDEVLDVIQVFQKSGHQILSPKTSNIIRNDDGFVILASDNSEFTHIDIQTMVFHRVFRSDFVYVWNPEGYVGKTTCYEIGRILERKIPLYYKEMPTDVPIYVPQGSVLSVEDFINYVKSHGKLPLYYPEENLVTKELINDLENNKFHY